MSETSNVETHEFRAEIQQLLDILVHSVYTSKDIFIRELISNAADALEKVRFSTLRGESVRDEGRELEIRIETRSASEKDGDGGDGDDGEAAEDEENVLVISDSGIGMDAEEVRQNIGTIAHSGATAFVEALKQKNEEQGDLSLIGRFGVGFYSVFMAAEKVVITTASANPDAEAVTWTSNGLGKYTIEPVTREVLRGTQIEIHLKKEEKRFADAELIKGAIRKYSNFVPFPVFVNDERVNETTALWREQPSQVKKEQYAEFFKYLTHDASDPTLHLHLNVDAPLQFSSLLFVPEHNSEIAGFGEGKVSVQLYVKRVLIDPDNETLLPKYLRFVRGVIESEDLPLNVSRETLQENTMVFKIRETLTRKLLDLFQKHAEKKPEEYNKFWKTFGRIIKEGHSDYANREKFVELLRFNASSHDDVEGLMSLSEYVDSMAEGQKDIYYLSGASREALERDPRLELFRKKGLAVLYLHEMADEFVLGGLDNYKDHKLVSADQVQPSDLQDLGDGAEEDKESDKDDSTPTAEVGPLLERFKEILGDRVIDVRESERLVDSPACLVGDDSGMSGHMDKVMRLINKDAQLPKRVLEVNPKHGLIRDLAALVEKDAKDAFVERACEQLFEGSMLVDGYLTDPHELVRRMGEVLEEAAALRRNE
ncbi:MAG: molecular chaperone HtpG [Planctomycetota bacterium]